MLNNVWMDVEITRMKHEEFVENAEHARLGERRTNQRLPLMLDLRKTIGGWLVAIGQHLQPPAHLHKTHEC